MEEKKKSPALLAVLALFALLALGISLAVYLAGGRKEIAETPEETKAQTEEIRISQTEEESTKAPAKTEKETEYVSPIDFQALWAVIYCTVFPDIDAVHHIVERVIFVDAYDVQCCLAVFFYRHTHRDAQFFLKNSGGAGGKIVSFFEECKKVIVQTLRRSVDALNELPVQIIQCDGVQLIDFGSLC